MSLTFLFRLIMLIILLVMSGTASVIFANIQTESRDNTNQTITIKKSNTDSFKEFKSRKEKIFHFNREQDKLKRKLLIKNQWLPKSFSVKKIGRAVFVSDDLLQANSGSIQDILRGTKLSPYKNSNGSTLGYTIKATKKGSFASLLGFNVGDIIYRVNNFDIVSMSSIYKAYRRILKKDPDKVVVVYSSEEMPTKKEVLTFFTVDIKVQ